MSKFKNITHGRHEGKVVLTKSILKSIIILSVDELPNVQLIDKPSGDYQRSNSVSIDRTKDGLVIHVDVKVHYTERISTISFRVQESIRHNVETVTNNRVSAVNVTVCGVFFEEKPREKGAPIFSSINAEEVNSGELKEKIKILEEEEADN